MFISRTDSYVCLLTDLFSGSAGKNKFGDFTGSTGNWKTLIDRPMYNNDGTYRDQTRINVTNYDNEMLKSDYAEKTYPEYKIQEPNEERAARVGAAYADRIQHIHAGLLHFQRTPAWREANNGRCVRWHSPECSFHR